jgi:hypothetical protein
MIKLEKLEMKINEHILNGSKNTLIPLETRLNGLLKPVQPRPEFINSLRDHFQLAQNPAIISRFSNLQFSLMMIVGVISGVVVMTMTARVLLNLLSLGKRGS